jgi:hypothetical protein
MQKARVNLGLSELQKSEFVNCIPAPRPIVSQPEIPNLDWIAGFASGEACFLVSISKSNRNKIGQVVQLIFKLSQHNRDKVLLESIIKYLNCGIIFYHSKNAFVLTVSNFGDIATKLIPIFKKHSTFALAYPYASTTYALPYPYPLALTNSAQVA